MDNKAVVWPQQSPLTLSEAEPAEQTEEQQPPHLLQALLQGGEHAALCQVEPQLQAVRAVFHGVFPLLSGETRRTQ